MDPITEPDNILLGVTLNPAISFIGQYQWQSEHSYFNCASNVTSDGITH